MISIDTNILVRLLTGDDKEQAVRAKRLFLDEHIYITKTVILETEWVLRYADAFSADALYLVCSQDYPFATFDKKLKTKAIDAGVETVRLL